MSFAWPWLLLLLPLPWFSRRFIKPQPAQLARLHLPGATRFSANLKGQQQSGAALGLLWLVWILFLIALARPQWQGEPIGRPLEGRDLMVAVDLSGSMSIEDMELGSSMVDRLTIVKEVVTDFMERRQGDRVGLVLFGDSAYLQAPLTFDRETVATFLDEAVLGLVGRRTAIGDGIGVSVKHMLSQKTEQKVLVLLTDGDNTSGKMTPEQATEIAKEHGVTIYTVGVGADVMMQRSLFGQRAVNPSQDLNENALKAIANGTGGQYFRARDAESLAQVYEAIDALEPVASDQTFFRPVEDIFYYPLMAALGIALLILLLRLKEQWLASPGGSHD